MLYRQLGVPVVAGICAMCLLLLAQVGISKHLTCIYAIASSYTGHT